jgi:hypothetical protein
MQVIELEPSDDVAEAAWIGPRLHPFNSYDAGSVIPTGFDAYARLDHDREGVLPEAVARALVGVLSAQTSNRDPLWLAMWEGYGYMYAGNSFATLTATRLFVPEGDEPGPSPIVWRRPPSRHKGTPRLRLPGRAYLLYRGSLAQVPGWMEGPNLWWPADLAWCVASEIDLPWTFVGGSTDLIEAVLGDQDLNARRTSVDESNVS